MFLFFVSNFLIGFCFGLIVEFVYRSSQSTTIVEPKFTNFLMYGLTAAFLSFLYFLEISLIGKIILIFVFPTFVEFIFGYSYLKITKVIPWDYSEESFNFKGIICLLFSFYWFLISLVYYFAFLPLLIRFS